MTALRAITAFTGLLSVLLGMSMVAFGYWLTHAWPPPERMKSARTWADAARAG